MIWLLIILVVGFILWYSSAKSRDNISKAQNFIEMSKEDFIKVYGEKEYNRLSNLN